MIEVSFTHADPYVAAKVVNTLVDAFKDKHLEVFSGNNTEFLESQQKTFQNKLRESESNLANFKEKNRVFSFEEQKTALIGQRSTLDTTLKTAQNQISELEQRITFIKSPRWTVDAAPEIRTQLAALQQRERELLEKYTENSRTVQNQRQEMQAVKDSIKRSSEEQRQIELAKNEGELSVVRARADSLKRQLGQVEGEIRSLEASGRNLQDLKREARHRNRIIRPMPENWKNPSLWMIWTDARWWPSALLKKPRPPRCPRHRSWARNKWSPPVSLAV